MYRNFGKRILDISAVVLVTLVLSLPLFLIVIWIKFFDPGPVIYIQKRVGRNGEIFSFYKFRSMPINTRHIPSDQIGQLKLTRVGKFLRRTNLDELPQLYNILRGDMSIVGPRPSMCSQQDLIQIRQSNGSLSCRPGLTGLAQVNSYDGMPVDEKAAFDAAYCRLVTFVIDVRIVLKTLLYLLNKPPVY